MPHFLIHHALLIGAIFLAVLPCSTTAGDVEPQTFEAPRQVAVPPVDAGRGLIRVSETELRHYAGQGSDRYLASYDNGETWEEVSVPESFPEQVAGISKEGCSLVQLQDGEWLRFQPIRGHVWRSRGGIDGTWRRLLNPNAPADAPDDARYLALRGISRNGVWVKEGQRLILPAHSGGSWVWYSDDGGETFARSEVVRTPNHEIDQHDGGVHRGRRWNHGAAEPTVVELNDGRLWMIIRTSQDQHWQCYSEDFGTTWSDPEPSRFWGTCTMPTIVRLKDGRLLMSWTNTAALPESLRSNPEFRASRGERAPGGEDVFTNRDSHHLALSDDDGVSWYGFREVMLDENRNNDDYAVTRGSNDRGLHQGQIIELDENRILLAMGQHPVHRRMVIVDLRWLAQTRRSSELSSVDALADWSHHAYIPQIRGHCGYNREAGGRYEPPAGDAPGCLTLARLDAPQRTAPEFEIDYLREGATWNFPAANAGRLDVRLRLNEGGQGLVISLHDRLFNPVDVTAQRFSPFALTISGEGDMGGDIRMVPGQWHTLSFIWDGHDEAATCRILLDGQAIGEERSAALATPNGLSYVHFISAANSIDTAGFSIAATSMQTSD